MRNLRLRALTVAVVLSTASVARGQEPAGTAPREITLPQALELATRSSPRLRAARIEPAIARAQLVQAGLLPNPSLSLGYTRVVQGDTQNRYNVGVSTVVDVSGERGARVRRAQVEVRAAEVRADSAVLATATEVGAQFTKVLYLQMSIELRREAVDLGERLLAAARLRRDAGDLSRAGVEQAELAFERARGQLLESAGELRRERGVLGSLIGGELPDEFRAAGELPAGRGGCDREALLARMRHGRPDLQLLSIAVSQAELDAEVSRASRIPDFDIGASVSVRDPSGSSGVLVGGSVAFPLAIFDRRQGDVLAAEHNADAARARREEAARSAEQELGSLCAHLEAVERFLAHVDARISPLAQHRRESVVAAFRLGEVRLEDTILASRELLDIEQASLDAVYQHSAARLALDAATGTSRER